MWSWRLVGTFIICSLVIIVLSEAWTWEQILKIQLYYLFFWAFSYGEPIQPILCSLYFTLCLKDSECKRGNSLKTIKELFSNTDKPKQQKNKSEFSKYFQWDTVGILTNVSLVALLKNECVTGLLFHLFWFLLHLIISFMVLCLIKFENTSRLMFEIISSYRKKLFYLIVNL